MGEPVAEWMETLSRLRSKTLAPLVDPNDFPRIDDQPVSPVTGASAFSFKGEEAVGFSSRVLPRFPTPAPDM